MKRNDLPPMPLCTACGECCTVVRGRPDEIKRIRHFMRDNDVEWVKPAAGEEQLRCGFLRDQPDGSKACGIYEARPWACRAFGVIAQMPCTYFPEAIKLSLPADEAVVRRLTDPDDLLLGEAFEGPAYLERIAEAVANEAGITGVPPGYGAAKMAEMRRRRLLPYVDGSPKLQFN